METDMAEPEIILQPLEEICQHLKTKSFHTAVLLFYAKKGTGLLELENDTFEIKPGQIYLIDAYREFKLTAMQLKGWSIQFSKETLSEIQQLHPEIQELSFFHPGDEPFAAIGPTLNQSLKQLESQLFNIEGSPPKWLLFNLLPVLFAHLSDTNPQIRLERFMRRANLLLKRFKTLLIKHRNESHQIDFYCKVLNTRLKYLNHVCRVLTGKSCKQFSQQILLEHIDNLMENPNLSIKEIMEKTGFKHSNTFVMHFRKLKGCTPAHFRKSAGFRTKHMKLK